MIEENELFESVSEGSDDLDKMMDLIETSSVQLGDKLIRGHCGGVKFKIQKGGKFLERCEQVRRFLAHDLNDRIKKERHQGPKTYSAQAFSFYPQGLKNTISAYLNSDMP